MLLGRWWLFNAALTSALALYVLYCVLFNGSSTPSKSLVVRQCATEEQASKAVSPSSPLPSPSVSRTSHVLNDGTHAHENDGSLIYSNKNQNTSQLCPYFMQDPSLRNGARVCLPYMVGIGTMKGGSTSIFNNLRKHPNVCRGETRKKEMRWFRLIADTLSVTLPQYMQELECLTTPEQQQISMEFTPMHLLYPVMAKWLKQNLPHVQLVVVLRDPVKRAISNYAKEPRHYVQNTFDEMIEDLLPKMTTYYQFFKPKFTRNSDGSVPGFETDLPSAWDAMPMYLRRSPIGRGLYSEQLVSYLQLFPREQVHVYFSEHLFANSTKFFTQLTSDLRLPAIDWGDLKTSLASNQAPTSNSPKQHPPKESTIANLKEFYRPFNAQLSKMLGVDVSKVWGEY